VLNSVGRLLAFLSKIRLTLKNISGSNTLAYVILNVSDKEKKMYKFDSWDMYYIFIIICVPQ